MCETGTIHPVFSSCFKTRGFRAIYCSGLGSGLPLWGFPEFTRFNVHNEEFMDVQYLGIIPALDPAEAGLGFLVADDRGQFDQHGTGGLEQGIQGRVFGADVQASFVDAIEPGAGRDGGLHIVDETLDGRDGLEELGLEALPIWACRAGEA